MRAGLWTSITPSFPWECVKRRCRNVHVPRSTDDVAREAVNPRQKDTVCPRPITSCKRSSYTQGQTCLYRPFTGRVTVTNCSDAAHEASPPRMRSAKCTYMAFDTIFLFREASSPAFESFAVTAELQLLCANTCHSIKNINACQRLVLGKQRTALVSTTARVELASPEVSL